MQAAMPAKSRSLRKATGGHRRRRCSGLAGPSSRFFGERRELLHLVLGGKCADQIVELAVHDALDLVEREVDAVVGHPALGEVVGADALRAVAGADQEL